MTKHTITISILLSALILSSCTASASKAVTDLAIERVQESDGCSKFFQCRDFKVTRQQQLDLTSADKANGVESKWCVQVDYIFSRDGKFWEDNNGVIRITQSRDTLKIIDEHPWGGTSFWSCP